ncbi:MAG TPA: ABC transporter permease [Blastocatellia bacterium]|nr:ABC transporter permease [Blastocatellia bacterium]
MKLEHWFYTVPLRLRSLFGRKQVDRELSDELRDHLEQQIEDNIARGMSHDEARRSAMRAMGSVARIERECRDARRVNTIEDFFQDLRYGLRQLRRSPGFAALAILCLTLGIGANAAVFSWLEGILFRPYPLVAHQDRLLALDGTTRDSAEGTEVSWPDFLDLQRNCTLIDSFILSKITGATLSIGERAETTTGSIVSANYFDAIGVRPIMGRGFEPGEDSGRDAHPVVVISYQLWQGRFKGDPDIIGKVQRFNSVPHTIIGVTPEGFRGTFVGWAMNFWVPASMEDLFEGGAYKLEDRGARWIESYVSLKPGVTRNQAQQEVSAIAARLERDYPASNLGRGFNLFPLWQTPFNNARTLLPTLEIMVAVVAFVLLIACANVGNLLLVRAFARRHEMTVRLAIGAGRRRLVKQLLTEGLILSVCGAAGGILVAYWSRHALALLFPARAGVSMYLPGEIDWRVLATSAGICLMATLLIGLVPAFQTRNLDLSGALKAETAGVVGARGRTWVRSSLVVLQVCLSFILLVGAVLLMQSLQKIRTTSPGFTTSRVMSTKVSLVAAGYDATRSKVFQDQLADRMGSLAGVESVAHARVTPLGYGTYDESPIALDGYEAQPGEQLTVEYNQVSPEYFFTMGIPIVSGREFTRADDENAAPVAVVNETMAARYWRGQNPIGSRLQVKGRWVQVVGMAADSRYESMRETPRPFFYVPLRQDFVRGPNLYLRTSQPLPAMQAAVTREVRALDDNLALYEMITLKEQVDRSTSPQLVAVTLVAVLGGLALLLASIGLYGVMSYVVSQSTRELGLRMVLGAAASDLLRMVLTRGLILTATGILIGTAASLLLTRLLSNLLYNISPRDPLAFGAALAVMTITATVACCLPAWRAMRTDPAKALRN